MPDYIKQLKIGNNNYNIKAEKAANPNSNAAVLRNISYGTGSPSGGSDGDMYIQYNTTSTHPFLDLVYPVGAIYLSTVNTNPGTLFGGTWIQIKDRFLLAAGDTYAAGSTGGEAVHTLTKDELPNYCIGNIPAAVPNMHTNWNNGSISGITVGDAGPNKPGITATNYEIITQGHQYGWTIWTGGGGKSHNNMPPYLTVYVWKRTA